MSDMATTPDDAPQDGPSPETVKALPPALVWLQARRASIEEFLWSRHPTLLSTIITVLCATILLTLGTWQLERLDEKNNLLHQMEKQLAAQPSDLRTSWPQNKNDWRALNYRPIAVKGHWMSMRRFKLAPRTFEGQVGYQLIVPLRLADDQILLVNRGFVPDGAEIMPMNEDETVTLAGIARVPETRRPMMAPENVPSRGIWTWTDVQAMGHETGFSKVAPLVLYEAHEAGRDTYPIGGQLPLPTHNRHWQYAVTWFALALILMGVYMLSIGPKDAIAVANADDKSKKPEEDLSDPVARRGRYPEATD